jgi:hypothetical protein
MARHQGKISSSLKWSEWKFLEVKKTGKFDYKFIPLKLNWSEILYLRKWQMLQQIIPTQITEQIQKIKKCGSFL